MANKSLYIDKKELSALQNKLSSLGVMADQFDEELEITAKEIQSKARNDFDMKSAPALERRGEKTTGLSKTIRVRKLSRKSGTGSAYQISAGGVGAKLMAFIEFGTRARRINLSGITSLFGGDGAGYAKRFKGSDNPKDFTHLSARPYFFNNIFLEKKKMFKRLGNRVNQIIKKK